MATTVPPILATSERGPLTGRPGEIPLNPYTFYAPDPEVTGGPTNWFPPIAPEILEICPAATWQPTGSTERGTWNPYAYVECPDGRRWYPNHERGVWELSHPDGRGRNVRNPGEDPGRSPAPDDPASGPIPMGGVDDPPNDTVNITVNPVNDPPTIVVPGRQSFFTDFDNTFADSDNPFELSDISESGEADPPPETPPAPRSPWYRTPAGMGGLGAGVIALILAILLWPKGGDDAVVAAPSTTAVVTTTTGAAGEDPTPSSAAPTTSAPTTTTTATVTDPLAGLPGDVVSTGNRLGLTPGQLAVLLGSLTPGARLEWRTGDGTPPAVSPMPSIDGYALRLIIVETPAGRVPYFIGTIALDGDWAEPDRPGAGTQLGAGISHDGQSTLGGLDGYGGGEWNTLFFLDPAFSAFDADAGFGPNDEAIAFVEGRVATFVLPAFPCLRGPGTVCTVALTNFVRQTPPGAEPAGQDPTAYQAVSVDLPKDLDLGPDIVDGPPPSVAFGEPLGGGLFEETPFEIAGTLNNDSVSIDMDLLGFAGDSTITFTGLE